MFGKAGDATGDTLWQKRVRPVVVASSGGAGARCQFGRAGFAAQVFLRFE
jgi:hypothetical protein